MIKLYLKKIFYFLSSFTSACFSLFLLVFTTLLILVKSVAKHAFLVRNLFSSTSFNALPFCFLTLLGFLTGFLVGFLALIDF